VFEGSNVLDNPANNAPVGTGPYRFVQYERGQYIIAERNPTYWRKDLPYLDRIVWRVITDKSAVAASLESGQIQISPYNSLPLADLDRLKADPRFDISTRGLEANAFNNTLEFNTRRKELSDVRVRRAIAHATCRTSSITSCMARASRRPVRSRRPRPHFTLRTASRRTHSVARGQKACSTRPATSAVPTACASR